MNLQEMMAELVGHAREARARQDRYLEALEIERQKVAGIKPMQMIPLNKVGANPFVMGGDNPGLGQPFQSPDPGYVWTVRELIIEGLTAGGSPDVIDIWRGGTAGVVGKKFWQLNGNSFGVTWGFGEKLLFQGENLLYTSGSVFATTSIVSAHGIVQQVPAEMIGKLYGG